MKNNFLQITKTLSILLLLSLVFFNYNVNTSFGMKTQVQGYTKTFQRNIYLGVPYFITHIIYKLPTDENALYEIAQEHNNWWNNNTKSIKFKIYHLMRECVHWIGLIDYRNAQYYQNPISYCI